MALKEYSPELLRMVYLLGISKKRYYGKELEEYLVSNLQIESSRTIYRWMKKLKNMSDKEHTFDYFPSLNFSNLGLMRCEVLMKNPKDLRVIQMIPHSYWAGLFIDKDFNRILTIHYLIPPDSYNDMVELLESAKEKGLYDESRIFILNNGKYVPSPFHEIVTEQGNLNLNGGWDNRDLIRRLEIKANPVKIDNLIIDEPILIPILFEADKESSPHEIVYNEIKRRLGDRIQEFYTNSYNKYPDRPESGGPYIQMKLQRANDDFKRFFDHVRIYYKPLHEIRDVFNYVLTITSSNLSIKKVKGLIYQIGRLSLYISPYLGKDTSGNTVLRISVSTSFNHFMKLMVFLRSKGFDVEHYTLDQKISWYLWNREISKFKYWELFDPVDGKWLFNTEHYIDNQKII